MSRPRRAAGQEVSKRRPTWGRVVVAQAQVADLAGAYDVAIDKATTKAVLLGEGIPRRHRTGCASAVEPRLLRRGEVN